MEQAVKTLRFCHPRQSPHTFLLALTARPDPAVSAQVAIEVTGLNESIG